MSRRSFLSGSVVVAVMVGVAWVGRVGPPGPAAEAGGGVSPVGLSLFFRNGRMAPLTLVGGAPRYLQEIDIVVTTPTTPTDHGILPLIEDGEFADLDWRGVRLVEEDWRPAGDGTWTLQRFYRGARWMEQPSQFVLTPLDAAGHPVGHPIEAHAGKDDKWQPGDDGFVRRFVVRQTVRGCRARDDVTGANSFTADGLVQFRDALDPDKRAETIPTAAAALRLSWSRDPQACRTVAVSHANPAAFAYGYGFQVGLQVVNLPARGHFLPGETVTLRITHRDGHGNRLHPVGSLPTYGQFVRGEVASGVRYFDFGIPSTTYYALKHRESNVAVALSGPVNRLKTPTRTTPFAAFFAPQITVATPTADRYSAVVGTVPPSPVLLGGLFAPAVWDTPVADTVGLTLPADAPLGTYIAATKFRREWGGEALNRAGTVEVPVGPQPTTFVPKTGGCNTCHTGPSAFGNVLHGVSDRRACFACHASLDTEPDTALDIRLHMVHSRSARFQSVGGNIQNCALCHLTPPAGPLRNRGADGLAP